MNYHKTVPGWFNFQDLYSEIVRDSQDGDILVEVGVFLGKSLAYLVETSTQQGKKPQIYAVDLFEISPDHGDGAMPWDENAREWEKKNGGKDALWNEYNKYMAGLPNKELIKNSFRENSWDAAAHFEDGSVSFVFIDASHLYENTKRDVESWYPKMKKGGIMAGHDFNQGVEKAVMEFFPNKNLRVSRYGDCWVVLV